MSNMVLRDASASKNDRHEVLVETRGLIIDLICSSIFAIVVFAATISIRIKDLQVTLLNLHILA